MNCLPTKISPPGASIKRTRGTTSATALGVQTLTEKDIMDKRGILDTLDNLNRTALDGHTAGNSTRAAAAHAEQQMSLL